MDLRTSAVTALRAEGALFAIAQHLCSVESLGTPADNGDAIRRIGQSGVIQTPTAQAIVSAVGFRSSGW